MRRFLSMVLGSVFLLICVGCGPGSVSVTGQILHKGKPLKGSDDAPVQVSFCPMVNEECAFDKIVSAEVNQADGTFMASGIPAGKARISVMQVDRNSLEDRFKNRFDEAESPIVRDLVSGQPLTIDLDNPGGG